LDNNGIHQGRETVLDENQSATIEKLMEKGKPIYVTRIGGVNPARFTRVIDLSRQRASKPIILPCNGAKDSFSVSKTDLINAKQPTLTRIDLLAGKALYDSSIDKINDGDVYGGYVNVDTANSFVPSDGSVVEVVLNTVSHPAGYDIQRIVTLTGCGAPGTDRASQKYDLAYSLVSAPDVFITITGDKEATVDRYVLQPEFQIQIVAKDGPSFVFASGVAKIRFTFHNTSSRQPESVYREIDVFGQPTDTCDQKGLQKP
jgi:hypothetical protein